ncbi:hypothetical protein PUR34_03275 [Streptomyces sp. JV185]|uniref:hypothetical protein n=1 Tax=Streptomyces sp. JV185 TaxID=858638 RepID=UPI002E788412|nr:hypothetical protein [Streptomyces sp. JV185]MEE1767223.1 hypothetical protein [Streptomyces sp. JV185]
MVIGPAAHGLFGSRDVRRCERLGGGRRAAQSAATAPCPFQPYPRADGTGAHRQRPAAGEDLLAIRLGLLGRPYHRPFTLTPGDVVEADRTLLRWRERVAHWACSPSKPVPREVSRAAADALAADLGTPTVLDLLLRAEVADGVPEGQKFEIFASLDRILGLELIREIDRPPPRQAG